MPFLNTLVRHKQSLKRLYAFRFPYFKPYAALIAETCSMVEFARTWIHNVLWYDQMIRYRCNQVGSRLLFQGTFPLIKNRGYIEIGDDVTFVGRNNLVVGFNGTNIQRPELIIGDDVVIGYRCEINVAQSIRIGHHVLIATGVKIFDNNSHPIDPEHRRTNAPMTREDIAPVVIHDNVWIGMEATILKGVTIGRGAIVATGSVVTKSVPDRVVVAGNPAKVVKIIEDTLYEGPDVTPSDTSDPPLFFPLTQDAAHGGGQHHRLHQSARNGAALPLNGRDRMRSEPTS
jgi:acetyltransferase-like isoleucine patch superfamily enzyme